MEKWCHICIIEARQRGIKGRTVVLADIDHCESILHCRTPLAVAIQRRRREAKARDASGRFVSKLA